MYFHQGRSLYARKVILHIRNSNTCPHLKEKRGICDHIGFEAVPPTPLKQLESTLQALDAKKEEWANLTTLKRGELLRETLKHVIDVSSMRHPMTRCFAHLFI